LVLRFNEVGRTLAAMRPRLALLTRPGQLAVLTSPVRQELLDVLARMGTVSLADVAEVLGRPADGLYYHVRLLVRAGLVRAAGTRTRGGRKEALFHATASQFAVRYPAGPAARARAMNAIVGSMLRLAMRDFRRAVVRDDVRLAGPERDVWALRTTGWLLPAHVRQVNRLIRRLSGTTARTAPRGRLYAVTVLLTPLDRRDRRQATRPPRKGSR
jgi:predicted transcriptional regulator